MVVLAQHAISADGGRLSAALLAGVEDAVDERNHSSGGGDGPDEVEPSGCPQIAAQDDRHHRPGVPSGGRGGGHGDQSIVFTRALAGPVVEATGRSSLTPGPPPTFGDMDDHTEVRGFCLCRACRRHCAARAMAT
jgi:hypothetical protein